VTFTVTLGVLSQSDTFDMLDMPKDVRIRISRSNSMCVYMTFYLFVLCWVY